MNTDTREFYKLCEEYKKSSGGRRGEKFYDLAAKGYKLFGIKMLNALVDKEMDFTKNTLSRPMIIMAIIHHAEKENK
jgi:hypothetical protein